MISSRADFFFFSPLVSELMSFLLVEDDAAALRALAPRTELHRETYQAKVIELYLLGDLAAAALSARSELCTWIWRGQRLSRRRPG